jgi:hypothetical protein
VTAAAKPSDRKEGIDAHWVLALAVVLAVVVPGVAQAGNTYSTWVEIGVSVAGIGSVAACTQAGIEDTALNLT